MSGRQEQLKWAETIYVVHGPDFGHKIYLATQIQGRDIEPQMDWQWRGLGIPAEIVKSAQAYAGAVLSEYLTFRYGLDDSYLYGEEYGVPNF
jgi:hypothetical protein